MIWLFAMVLVVLILWFAFRATPKDIANRRKPRDFNRHRDGIIMHGDTTDVYDADGDA